MYIMKKILIFIISALSIVGCGKERYAEINTDPTSGTAEITFLFAGAQGEMLGGDEYHQFYGPHNIQNYPSAQISLRKGGDWNNDRMFELSGYGTLYSGQIFEKGFGGRIKHIQNLVTKLPEQDRLASKYICQMSQIMYLYYAILGTDNSEMSYVDANKGLYTTPPLLILDIETQEELYAIFDTELKAAIDTLSKPVVNSAGSEVTQIELGFQDNVYNGDVEKWIRFGNSIRLKLALRLLHADPAKGKKIAEEVATSGLYLSSFEDDYRFVATLDNYGPYGSDYKSNFMPTTNFIEMMKNARDPRLRVFLHKNSYNPQVVQGMLDNGLTFPPHIADEMIVEDNEFIRWKSKEMGDGDQYLGEPWVRYQGRSPMFYSEIPQAEREQYDRAENFKILIGENSVERIFWPHATYNDQLVKPDTQYDYPSMKTVQDKYRPNQQYNVTVVLLAAAESQLILALYGAQGASVGDPAALYKSAIENSVKSYDFTASPEHLNILYYDTVYDTKTFTNQDGVEEVIEKPVGLQADELDLMFTLDANQLTGTVKEKVEKCFIQLTINAFRRPAEIFMYTKFGGIPMEDSKVWPRVNFLADDAANSAINIPRRGAIGIPDTNGQNYANYKKSLDRQGFTNFIDLSPPMEQRYWNDKDSPSWGKGPIVR